MGDSEVMKVDFSWVGLVLVQGPRELMLLYHEPCDATHHRSERLLDVIQEASSVVIRCLCSDK